MALTDLQKVRLKIQDVPIAENLTLYGDGTATVFKMAHSNLANAQAFVPVGGTAWSATGAAVDTSGQFIFSNVISANSAFNVRYQHTTFSDDDVQEFLNEGGSINGAALAAIGALRFDGLKRARWMAADGSQYDDTSAQAALAKMYEDFQKAVTQEASTAGGFGSWAENQAYWS